MSAVLAKVVPLSKAKQARLIDEIGGLKQQIAQLTELADQKISVFKDFGDGVYVGNAYKITVSTSDRQSLDTAVVKGFLTPAQVIKATVSTPVTKALVKAR
jgi:ClpP class serine protease